MKAYLPRPALLFLLLFGLPGCNKDSIEFQPPPFSAYPNPCGDVLNVILSSVPADRSAIIRLYDGQSGSPHEFGSFPGHTNVTIDMRDRPAGVFTIEVEFDNQRYSTPILKAL